MRTIPICLILLVAMPILADEPKVRGIVYAASKNERQMLDVYAKELEFINASKSKVDPDLSEQIDKLKKLGARITLDEKNRVIGVNLGERRVTDADLVHLRGFQHLQELDLTRTRITGAGLVNVKDLAALTKLFVTETNVDDSGIAHLKGMKGLVLVGLSGTKISDAALDHLREMTGLKQIFCLGTSVTEAGVEKLRRALPKCQITH